MAGIPQKFIRKFFQEEGLLDEVVHSVARDGDRAGKVVEDIVEELSAILKKDPDFKRRVLEGAFLNPKFEKEVIKKLRGSRP